MQLIKPQRYANHQLRDCAVAAWRCFTLSENGVFAMSQVGLTGNMWRGGEREALLSLKYTRYLVPQLARCAFRRREKMLSQNATRVDLCAKRTCLLTGRLSIMRARWEGTRFSVPNRFNRRSRAILFCCVRNATFASIWEGEGGIADSMIAGRHRGTDVGHCRAVQVEQLLVVCTWT